jgi:hypothetical protein
MKKTIALIAFLFLMNFEVRPRAAYAQSGNRTSYTTEYRNGVYYGIWSTPAGGITVVNITLQDAELELAQEQLRKLRAGK